MNATTTTAGPLRDFRETHGDPADWTPGDFDAWLTETDAVLASRPQADSTTPKRG